MNVHPEMQNRIIITTGERLKQINNCGWILLTFKSIPGFTAGSTLSMSLLVPCIRISDFSLLPRKGLHEERAPARRQRRNDDWTDAVMSDFAPASLLERSGHEAFGTDLQGCITCIVRWPDKGAQKFLGSAEYRFSKIRSLKRATNKNIITFLVR